MEEKMLRRKVIVSDAHGIYIRPAAKIVQACTGVDSKVTLRKGRNNANGSSILELLLLDAESGSEVEIVAEGTEEELAMRRVIEIF
jgi:phosphotransferase system HPr (HPr) family protein